MNRTLTAILTLAVGLSLLVSSVPARAADFYVDSIEGNDTTGTGTAGNPWKTLTMAVGEVAAGTAGSPNQIHVAAGTYDAANGETFPIDLSRDYINLLGDTGGTARILGAGVGNLIEINNASINAITIQDFTFAAATTAIYASNGGITLLGNAFENTIGEGFHLYINTTSSPLSTSYNLGSVSLTGNTFTCANEGVYVNVDLVFDDTTTGLTAALGGITVSNNNFNIGSGQIGLEIEEYAVENLRSGTISVGAVEVSGNTFSGGLYGCDIWGLFFENITNPAVTVGNFTVSGNTFTSQAEDAIYLDYYDIVTWSGSGTGTLGNLSISNNTITSSESGSYGIFLLDVGFIYDVGIVNSQNDSISVSTGSITITNNTISTSSDGIYIDFSSIMFLGGEATDIVHATFGATTISDNTVTSSTSDGIYIDLDYLGDNMYGQSTVDFGGITVQNNTITSNSEGLTFYLDNVGYDMYDSAQLNMSPITVRNNTINAGGDAVYIYYFDYYVASHMDDDTDATLPNWIITGNTLDSTGGRGFNFYTYANPDDNYGNAAAHFGSMLIDNNTFNPNKDSGMDRGVDLFIDDFCEGCYEASSATIGNITVSNNRIYATTNEGVNVWYGQVIYNPLAPDPVYDYSDSPTVTMGKSTFRNNTIDGATYGISLDFDDAWSGYQAAVTAGDMDFLNNTITNVSQGGIHFELDASNSDPGTATLSINRPLISGNTITADPGGALYGISLFGDIGGGVTFGTPEIRDNTVSGFTAGIYIAEGTVNNGLNGATVWGNTSQNNAVGLQFQADSEGFNAACNALVNNSKWGLEVLSTFTATVKAENNWWGAAAGPAACANCNKIEDGDGSVDYTPWLTKPPKLVSLCGGKGFSWPMFLPAITHSGP